MKYRYDGSYEGFLSVVYVNYYEKRASSIAQGQPEYGEGAGGQPSEEKWIATDKQRARRVEKALLEKAGVVATHWLTYGFRVNREGKELILLRFIEQAFKNGQNCIRQMEKAWAHPAYRLAREVSEERELLLASLRFREVYYNHRQYLYCAVEPEHDLLPLVAKYYAERYYSQSIVVHDIGRKAALVSYEGEWEIRPFAAAWEKVEENAEELEDDFALLWQGYFDYIALVERAKRKRNQPHSPLKYRNYAARWQPFRPETEKKHPTTEYHTKS